MREITHADDPDAAFRRIQAFSQATWKRKPQPVWPVDFQRNPEREDMDRNVDIIEDAIRDFEDKVSEYEWRMMPRAWRDRLVARVGELDGRLFHLGQKLNLP